FWKKYNRGVKPLYLGKNNHLSDASISQEHYMRHYPLDTHWVEQFILWHRKQNLNISNGLIALTHLVFHTLGANNILPFTLIHTGREGQEYER
ncbi:hypothetical protein ABTM83_19315, partial [Acinetobacter baumannii]